MQSFTGGGFQANREDPVPQFLRLTFTFAKMVLTETWALLSASLLNSVSAENVRECVPFCRELDLCSSMAQSDVSADAFASRACRILLREAARDGAGADPLFKYLGMFQVSSIIFF